MDKKFQQPVTLAPGERLGRDGKPYNFEEWKAKKIAVGEWLTPDQFFTQKKKNVETEVDSVSMEVDSMDSDDEPIVIVSSVKKSKKVHARKKVTPLLILGKKEIVSPASLVSPVSPANLVSPVNLVKLANQAKLVKRERVILELVKKSNENPYSSLIQRLIIFDTETTGIGEKDEIVEISLIETVEGIKTGRKLHFFINPEAKITKKAVEIHKLTKQRLKKFPRFSEVAHKILAFIGTSSLMAHNAGFDRRMINRGFEKAGISPLPELRFIDSLRIARFLFPGEKNDQNSLCERFEIDNFNRVTTGIHSAMEDTAQLYLIYRQLSKMLKEKGIDQGQFRL